MAKETVISGNDSGREAIIPGQATPQDENDRDLRPQRMEEMVGQRDVYERLPNLSFPIALERCHLSNAQKNERGR